MLNKFKKAVEMAHTKDPEMVALSVAILINLVESKREWNKLEKFLATSNMSGKQKLLIINSAREKSLKAWVNDSRRDK